MKHAAFILLLLTVLVSACNPGKQEVRLMPQEAKELFGLQTGSYWIMVDSATSLTDSLVVSSAEFRSPYVDTKQYRNEFLQFKADLYHAGSKTNVIEFLLRSASGNTAEGTLIIAPLSEIARQLESHHVVVFPVVPTSITGPSVSSSTRKLAQFTDNNRTYTDVIEYATWTTDSTRSDLLYFNKENGIIKIVKRTGSQQHTLKLVREVVRHL